MQKIVLLFSSFLCFFACKTETKIEDNTKIAIISDNKPSFSEQFTTEQVLLVIAPDESSIHAQMQFLEWDKDKKEWKKEIAAFPVTLGRTGLAWGKGLQPLEWNLAPLKKEGDGKAPQGIFPITSLFGYKAETDLAFTPQISYIQANNNLFCVDDVNSAFYNQLTDLKNKDWNSAETMLRNDNLYELGAVVAYNTQKPEKGDGSCVFIHIWRAADKATAGCTAMKKENIVNIFSKLAANKHPMLVQMTQKNAEKHLKGYGF